MPWPWGLQISFRNSNKLFADSSDKGVVKLQAVFAVAFALVLDRCLAFARERVYLVLPGTLGGLDVVGGCDRCVAVAASHLGRD